MRGPQLRVAAIVATGPATGPGRQLVALAQRLRARGAEFLMILLQRPGGGGLAAPDAPRPMDGDTPCELVPDRGPLDAALPGAVAAILRRWAPTVVQTHGYKATAVAYLLRRRGRTWPWIGCFHGATAENLKVRLFHRLDRWMLRRADRIVVMSREQAAQFAGCNGQVRVIRNAVIPLARPADPAEEERIVTLRSRLTPPVLGVVGRLSPEKGVDLFLEACALLDRRGIPFSAVVAGDGPERRRLELQRERLGLAPRVHLLGHVRAMHALYASVDVLVIPSRSEGLPNALLEALAAGVRVVGTRIGAIPEVLEGLEDCVLVPPGSAAALAAGVEQAVRLPPPPPPPPPPPTAGANGRRQLVVERYSLERRVADHVALYEELLQAGRR